MSAFAAAAACRVTVGVNASLESRAAAELRLGALAVATGGTHWGGDESPWAIGRIQVADQAELEAAVVAARAWLAALWNDDDADPVPPVQWGGDSES